VWGLSYRRAALIWCATRSFLNITGESLSHDLQHLPRWGFWWAYTAQNGRVNDFLSAQRHLALIEVTLRFSGAIIRLFVSG
jgi:hypothetical protein